MKRNLNLLALALCLGLFIGCESGCSTPLQPGSDPIVVRAQQTREIAKQTIDLFLRLEETNADVLWQFNPEIKYVADKLRTNAPPAIRDLTRAIATYKEAKNETNSSAITIGLAVVEQLLGDAQKYLALAQTRVKTACLEAAEPYLYGFAFLPMLFTLLPILQGLSLQIPAVRRAADKNPALAGILGTLVKSAQDIKNAADAVIAEAKRNKEIDDAEEAKWVAATEALFLQSHWQVRPDPLPRPPTT